MVIWANQVLRASLLAMQRTARALKREESAAAVEGDIAPLAEIFRLQGVAELKEAETRFLPRATRGDRAIVLAASRGDELGKLTEDRPKTMVEVHGEPLLGHIVTTFKTAGVQRISVVRGYRKEAVSLPGLAYVDNDEYETTGELVSLELALRSVEGLEGALFVSYGDVLFRRHALELLLEAEGALVLVVDTNWQESANLGRQADYVSCSAPPLRRLFGEPVRLVRMDSELPAGERHGEWIGLLKIGPGALEGVRDLTATLLADPRNRRAQLGRLLNDLAAAGRDVRVVYTAGQWLDVDTLYDVISAGEFRP